MSDRAKAFWLGLFIIGGIAVIAWLLLFLKPSLGDGKVTLRVRFSNIDKVVVGTRVTFGGKAIGEVEEITQVEDPRQAPADAEGNLYFYELTLKVDSSVNVYTYDEIIFSSSGLLGEKAIAIIPKAPPVGAPPAQNVTDEILYAESLDKLEATLNRIVTVAESFDETVGNVGEFFAGNADIFNTALTSFTEFSTSFTNGQGTIGRLLQSDSLYCQLTTVMCQLERVLSDVASYGIFFQFNSKWRRDRDMRLQYDEWMSQQPCNPRCD